MEKKVIKETLFKKLEYEVDEKYSYHRLMISEWKKQDREFVKEGDLVLIVGYRTSYDNREQMLHCAQSSGYLNKVSQSSKYRELVEGELMYTLHKSLQELIDYKYINTPEISFDEFTNNKIIRWRRVATSVWYTPGVVSLSLDFNTTLITSFNNVDRKDYIVFIFYKKEIMLRPGDSISFAFENRDKITFEIVQKSYKSSNVNGAQTFENRVLITDEELEEFELHNIINWKIILKSENREIIGGKLGWDQYKNNDDLVKVFKKFAKEYRTLVRTEVLNYIPLRQKEIDHSGSLMLFESACFVYLMHDVINDYYKIGISNNPEWRERTLQSEKPTIELIISKSFINRRLAAAFEKALHENYLDKRVRGEWFKLNAIDVHEIIYTLKS